MSRPDSSTFSSGSLKMRTTLRLVTLSIALLLVGLSAVASAGPPPRVFSHDALHFDVPDGVFVTSRVVQAPEGPVEVITLRAADPRGGQATGTSYVTLTLFSQPLSGEGQQEALALDAVLGGVVASLSRVVRVQPRAVRVSLAGESVQGQAFRVAFEDVEIEGTAAALMTPAGVVVLYQHDTVSESAELERLSLALQSLRLGPAPAELFEDDRPLRRLIVE